MSSKHTPGPLTVKDDGNGFFWVDKNTKDGGFTVCNTGDGVVAEANAILYAAAPAMLEALNKALPVIDNDGIRIIVKAAIKLAEKEGGL